ncbi:hypothetical protein EJ06DRAFT_534724 [Trichodelitschia bisporula]|uniref:ER membrane protein complex subunit 4 n=1 Tax=Trichodelitschia bisporula TaxID=703511 RepID=A0A6G1HIB5_9PEZI|nr:hypothetical protein EJ06DRAFT_534724 [Trichodelitschia bisporula]
MAAAPPPPTWVLALNAPVSSKPKALTDPPGFVGTRDRKSLTKTPPRPPPTTAETDTLKVKKAWELALAPAKQLPMNAIGMYMSGSSLQVFSIMMVFMLFKTPIAAIFGVQGAFARYETPGTSARLLPVKAVYVLMNLLAMGLGVWKINQMGLLPTTRSDWLAWEVAREPLERAMMA